MLTYENLNGQPASKLTGHLGNGRRLVCCFVPSKRESYAYALVDTLIGDDNPERSFVIIN
jgi:hypothetical protein